MNHHTHLVAISFERVPTSRPMSNVRVGVGDDSELLVPLLDRLSTAWNAEPSESVVNAVSKALVEEIVAASVVQYIASVLRHIRWTAGFLLIALVTTSLLIASYSFQPAWLVSLVFMMILFATVAALVYVSLEMNREDLLSRATGSDPGRVNWSIGFVVNLTLVGVVPILLAVSSQFPMIRNALFAWVDPILREVLHG